MRLIDADRFLEYMTDKCDMSAELDPIILGIFRGALKEQPTAYSVDKVVEELEERKALHERLVDYETKNGTVTEKYQHIKAIDVLNDAIEIVKQGCVSDDVCEWKVKSNYYVTKCSHDTDVMYGLKQDFKFCPYCGKKIKVVE